MNLKRLSRLKVILQAKLSGKRLMDYLRREISVRACADWRKAGELR